MSAALAAYQKIGGEALKRLNNGERIRRRGVASGGVIALKKRQRNR